MVRESVVDKRVPTGGVFVLGQSKEVQVVNVCFLKNLTDPVSLGLGLGGAACVVDPCAKKSKLR